MGFDAGEVFVARNVANQVIGTDMSMMSVIQYAVNVLKVPHIVICGHYDCGGVKASMENVDHVPPLENWLRNIRDTYRLNRQELDRIYDKDQRTRRLVELNTIEQAFAVFKTGCGPKKKGPDLRCGGRAVHAAADPRGRLRPRSLASSKNFNRELEKQSTHGARQAGADLEKPRNSRDGAG